MLNQFFCGLREFRLKIKWSGSVITQVVRMDYRDSGPQLKTVKLLKVRLQGVFKNIFSTNQY